MNTQSSLAIAAVLATAALGLSSLGAEEAPAVSDAEKAKLMEVGQANFVTCMACHGPDGQGLQVGPMKMAPTFTGSKILLGDPELPIEVILKGIQKEDAKYAGVMAPLGAMLDDEKMAGVLTYVRNSFGNSAPAVTPEQVAKVREATKGETAQLKRADIEKRAAEAEAEAAE